MSENLPMQNSNVTRVLMIRHTDVENPENIIYGRLPRFGLSSLGESQAKSVASFLEGLPVTALYSSPQLRARQTAEIVNRTLHVERIHVSRRIAEVLTGYEGQSNSILGGKLNFYDQLARPQDESIVMILSGKGTVGKLLWRLATPILS
jgi:broad specificity phosphatase PhoE